MRKEETTEQAVKRLMKKCDRAMNSVYAKLTLYDQAIIAELDKISRAVNDHAVLALQAERRGL